MGTKKPMTSVMVIQHLGKFLPILQAQFIFEDKEDLLTYIHTHTCNLITVLLKPREA